MASPLFAPVAFAELLRRHRLAVGLTQEALAERAGLSVNGIQKLEAGGTHPYRDTLRRLVQALELSADETAAFQVAAQPPPRMRASASRVADTRLDLPVPLTSFVGRERETRDLALLVSTTRLVTLTGVGGCGKTRLALEVARLAGEAFAHGVRLVELAPLADPTLVPQAVASALGIRETATQPPITTLIAALKGSHLLLLLDNCEHLLDACAQLANTLLLACPRMHILATSREALAVPSELSRRVPSLPVPPLQLPPTAQLMEYEAVQLFVERASAYSTAFAISDRNAVAIAQVCQRLDGIPLALELAAALVRALSVEEVAGRLDERFSLLTGGSRAALPRQQTLRATLDWSYELLSPAEQTLLSRLSVFAGQWTVDATEQVCVIPDAQHRRTEIEQAHVLQLLLRLVDKSLVVVAEEGSNGGTRFRLLDTLRQYGRERLLASGSSRAVRSQHARYYLALAERARPELEGPLQAEWIEQLASEQSDLRAALDWFVEHGAVHEAQRLAVVLGLFWEIRGHLSEGRQQLATVLAMPGAGEPTLARAAVLQRAGVLALWQGDLSAARVLLRDSLALYRGHQNPGGLAWALIYVGLLCNERHRYRAARRFVNEALDLCRRLSDRRGIARCLNVLGLASTGQLDQAATRALQEECVALSREVGDRWGTGWALTNLAITLLNQIELGDVDVDAADAILGESAQIWRELGERRHLAYTFRYQASAAARQGHVDLAGQLLLESDSTLNDMQDVPALGSSLWVWAQVFAAQGNYEHAACALGASQSHAVARGEYPPIYRVLRERRRQECRDVLGAELADAAWTRGMKMSLDEALGYVWRQARESVRGAAARNAEDGAGAEGAFVRG